MKGKYNNNNNKKLSDSRALSAKQQHKIILRDSLSNLWDPLRKNNTKYSRLSVTFEILCDNMKDSTKFETLNLKQETIWNFGKKEYQLINKSEQFTVGNDRELDLVW
jgi:hypothetical protein